MDINKVQIISFFALLTVFSSQALPSQRDNRENFSLVISGGISLGVYEAGMNWVLSEYAYQNKQTLNLKSLTGASAGAVNTIFTAVRKCLDESKTDNKDLEKYSYKNIENNPFAIGWRKLDISQMIPEATGDYDKFSFPVTSNPGEVEYRDGVIKRKVFEKVLSVMGDFVSKAAFMDGCSVNIGIPVTRDEPVEFPVKIYSSESSIKMQRFSIPIIAVVENCRLKFKNNIDYAENSPGYGYIFLPEDDKGYIAFSDVVRAALASSAFPVAFGRVKLNYCIRNGASADHGDDTDLKCPKGHHGEVYTFVDGGIFDNIPLGLAIDLTECTNPLKSAENIYCSGHKQYKDRPLVGYVFMDPDRRRNTYELRAKGKRMSPDYDLKNQMGFFSGSVEVARKDELYSTIVRDFSTKDKDRVDKKEHRALLITRRYPPITAKYLNYFGAFLSQTFRDYDYYAGIYDGIINVALYQYRKETKTSINYKKFDKELIESVGKTSRLLVDALGIKANPGAFQVFTMLAMDEFELNKLEYKEWQWLIPNKDPTGLPAYQNTFNYTLYTLLKKLETDNLSGTSDSNKSEFTLFLEGLKKIKEENEDNQTIVTVYEKDLFLKDVDKIKNKMNGVAKRVLSRLKMLEMNSQDGSPYLMSLASLAVDARNEVHDLNTWKTDSTGQDKSRWWSLLPNELAADVAQTGVVLTYFRNVSDKYTVFGDSNKPFCYGYTEFEGVRLHLVRDTVGREDFVSSGLNYRCAMKGPISSFGIGYRLYHNINNTNPELSNKAIHGIGLTLGLLADKLRIGVEYRFIEEGFKDEKLLVTLGISDLRGSMSSLAN